MVKGNDAFCPACGQHWEVCLDQTHSDPSNAAHRYSTPSRHTTYRDDWGWQRGQSQSPRQRQRPRSRRQQGYGQDPPPNRGKGHGKGHGKNFKGAGSKHNAHGLGQEGMAPLPPPPLPTQTGFGDAPWAQLQPPFPATGAPAVELPAPVVNDAEIRLQKVLGVLKKNETELPPEVSAVVKDTKITDGMSKIKNMHDAVELLGDAQQAFETACFARAKNLASWRQFLHLSVQRWQEYSQHFQTQERQHMDLIAQAKERVHNAQGIFKSMQEKGIITIDAEEDPAMMDAETTSTKQEGSTKIQQGLEHMTTALENLAKQADIEFEEDQQQKKRPRKEPPGEETAGPSSPLPPGSKAMEPFGGAHGR